jgi:DNA-binding transcriptional LysR family regulator
MPRPPHNHVHAYKDITFQQLRSFFGTVRLGSLTAAASLRLTHPTVWKQVRYVELGFGIGLITRVAASPSRRNHLHERRMSQFFGRPTVYLIRRRGDVPFELATEFAQTVKATLSGHESACRKSKS